MGCWLLEFLAIRLLRRKRRRRRRPAPGIDALRTALEAFGCERLFAGQVSSVTDRPKLKRAGSTMSARAMSSSSPRSSFLPIEGRGRTCGW